MIVAFDDKAARAAFLDLVERERPDIRRACREARALPHVVIRIENQGEAADWIAAHVRDFAGRAHENIALQPFRPA